MNWNIVFVIVAVSIAGFMWYDMQHDALLEQQQALERQEQQKQELKAQLEQQRKLLAEQQEQQRRELQKARAQREDDLAFQKMEQQLDNESLAEDEAERDQKRAKKQLERAQWQQEFDEAARLRQAYEECLREADDPDQCPDYNDLRERLLKQQNSLTN